MQIKSIVKKSGKLFEPVDIASLVFFRVVFGLVMLWEATRLWRAAEAYFLRPKFQFKYYGFAWVHVLPGDGIYYLIALLGILASLIALGFFHRIAAALFFVGITYIFLLDKTYYLNHMYLVSILSFLLIIIPCHRSFSLDALINPKLRSQFVPAWSLWLLRAQIGIPYFYGGLAKLNPDWLRGEPMRTWLAELTSIPLVGHLLTEEWVVYLFSYGGLGFDLLIVPLLLFRKTRAIAFIASAMFHLTNAYIFNIGIFPWLMIPATLIFFPPSWPRRLMATVRRKELDLEAEVTPTPELFPAYRRLTICFLMVYLAIQVLVPFRQALYPGYSSWTEEGYRFSWNMKLDENESLGIFYVTDAKSHQKQKYPPEKIVNILLTRNQYLTMAASPDMILQFAHYLAELYKEKGYPDVEVKARALVTLNGRPPRLLIDPKVNLAKVKRRRWPPAPWILPLRHEKQPR
jgi:hypothetical protein